MDLEKLKENIKKSAENGEDFGCACYYCDASPIDLVNRGDAIPLIYTIGPKEICFRCTEGGYYVQCDHVKNITKKIQLIKSYSGFDDQFRDRQIEKLSVIKEIQDLLEEHPIGFINTELLMKSSVFDIKKVLQRFKDDLMPKEDEI